MRPIKGKRISRINLEPAKTNSYVILRPFVYETPITPIGLKIKRWNGTDWITISFAKRWNGTDWINLTTLKKYSGNWDNI